MRSFYYFSFTGLVLSLFLISNFEKAENVSSEDKIKVTVSVTNCEKLDSLFLFEFNGLGFNKIQSVLISEDVATFSLPQTEPRFYYVGLAANNVRPLIVGSEANVGLSSNCRGFRQASVDASELNKEYDLLKNRMTGFSNEKKKLDAEFRMKQHSEEVIKEMHGKYKDLDARQRAKFAELEESNSYLSKVFALNTYLNFQVNGSSYSDELQYFAYEYFQLVDWNDKELEFMPWVYESMKSYTTTLSSINLPAEPLKKYLDYTLSRVPNDSRTYQLALGGVLAGLEEKQNANYKYFGEIFIEKYGETMPLEAAQVKKKISNMGAFVTGGLAPDFTMNTPEGTPMSLSEFRGKVTLVDFWASWCGPCRRENPHVVKLYNKYKDQGFDILGVSLDGNKERWLQAIEKDGLPWSHVSDLKKWGNAAAKMYGVRSIPHTVLLDKEGRIIARGLRSAQLEQQLVKIFGE